MRVLEGIRALSPPPEGSSVVVGTFDGVHIGHRLLIGRGVDEANRRGCASVGITWDRHPTQTLAPSKVPPLLTTLERKLELLAAAGLEATAVLEFDEDFITWPPERFAADVLAGGLGARAVFVGDGFRFGHRAAGTVGTLQDLGRSLGFAAEGVRLMELGGETVSSTKVRGAMAAGDLELAARLLGRPAEVEGVVVRGDARGHALGYPTANLQIPPGAAMVPNGVYAGCVQKGRARYRAAVSVGINPTFRGSAGRRPRLEAYLLDFDGDLYGDRLRIELLGRLRDELAFDSVEALTRQMSRDVEAAASLTC